MQLMRMMNTCFGKQKETACRSLSFHLPRLVSLSAEVRMIEDNFSAVSILDVYKQRMSNKASRATYQSNPLLTSTESVDIPLMHYFEGLRIIASTSNKYIE